jgi:hypothetical protein
MSIPQRAFSGLALQDIATSQEYIMKLLTVILLISLLFSCSNSDHEISGFYNQEIKLYERIRYCNNRLVNGSTLNLESDSTFIYATCGMISSGRWKTSNDTLLLLTAKKRFKIDSFNNAPKWKKYLVLSDESIMFKIHKGELSSKFKTNGISYVNILHKVQ